MPDTPVDDRPVDDERLRRLVEAMVDEAPLAPTFAQLPARAGSADGQPATSTGGSPASAGPARRRRPTLAVAAAVLVLAGAVAAVAVRGDDDDDPPAEFVAGLGPEAPGPQPLIIPLEGVELLDDGTLADIGEPGRDGSDTVWMPDGRVISLGVVQEDLGPGVTDDTVPFHLRVTDADGTILVDRRWEGGERPARLLGATAATAVLLRDGDPPLAEDPDPADARIVTHDLATGDERVVAGTAIPVAKAEAYGDTLVTAGPDAFHGGPNAAPGTCGIEVVSLVDGTTAVHPLPERCQEVRGLKVSQDGTHVAVAYGSMPAPPTLPEVRVAIVDLTASAVVVDELLGHDLLCTEEPCPEATRRSYLGMAWDDVDTLRVALDDLTAVPERFTSDVALGPDGMPTGGSGPEALPAEAVVVESLSVP